MVIFSFTFLVGGLHNMDAIYNFNFLIVSLLSSIGNIVSTCKEISEEGEYFIERFSDYFIILLTGKVFWVPYFRYLNDKKKINRFTFNYNQFVI